MTNIKTVDSKTLQQWLDRDEAILVDVRELAERNSCAIPNSKHIPLADIANNDVFLSSYKGDKKIVIHCKSGKRSNIAAGKLIKTGVNFEVWDLDGGIDGWRRSGLPTSSSNFISIERQLHTVLGIFLLLGLLLYQLLHNNWFLLLPMIVGIGLLNSGITGWCGLAKLIAILPWNKKG